MTQPPEPAPLTALPPRLADALAQARAGHTHQVHPADLADSRAQRALLARRRPLTVTDTWQSDWDALRDPAARHTVLTVALALGERPSHPALGSVLGAAPDGQPTHAAAGRLLVYALPVVGGAVLLCISEPSPPPA